MTDQLCTVTERALLNRLECPWRTEPGQELPILACAEHVARWMIHETFGGRYVERTEVREVFERHWRETYFEGSADLPKRIGLKN